MIEGEVAALLQGPCSLIVGTVDASGLPAAARAFGLELLDGGERVRLVMAATAAPNPAPMPSEPVRTTTSTASSRRSTKPTAPRWSCSKCYARASGSPW